MFQFKKVKMALITTVGLFAFSHASAQTELKHWSSAP